MRPAVLSCFLVVSVLAIGELAAQTPEHRRLEREVFAQLVEINTSDSAARTEEAAQAMRRRLLDAGFPSEDVRILRPAPDQGMLVARYRGTGALRPVLLMAHLDVVDARREDWSMNPYTFNEVAGFYYGRGSNDNKAGAAILIANFIRLRQEGFTPARDLIIVLTSDEETDQFSIQWILSEHRDLVDAEFALNTDGGPGESKDGRPVAFMVQAAEKVFQSFALEVRNPGGHSSVPMRDNAIYRLSHALTRIEQHRFPVHLTEVSRAYFAKAAGGQDQRTGAAMRALAARDDPAAAQALSESVPYYNSVMRTTCVATQLYAGHAENALPQLARATVNCRIVPGESPEAIRETLQRVVADTAVRITPMKEAVASPPSPLTPEILDPVNELAGELWPGVMVIPEQSTGATDGLYTRNAGIPTYGISALFDDIGDNRAHGRDERVGVEAFHRAAEYWYRLLRRVAGPGSGA